MYLELRSKEELRLNIYSDWSPAVMRLFNGLPVLQYNFEQCDFKLNGVIYTENTDAFVKAVEQELVWEKLNA